MRLVLIACVCILSLFIIPAARAQQHCSYLGESRLKFLDDLFHPFVTDGEEDPYEERIETERHDFTQSTTTVGRGVVQLEAGYSYFYKDEEDEIEQVHTTPEMLLRVGLTEDIEFRTRWTYNWQFFDADDNLDSAQDMVCSFKLGLTDEECWLPESALEIRSSFPTGGRVFTTTRVEFGLDYIYGWKLNDRLSLAGSTGMSTGGLDDLSLLPDEPASDHFLVLNQSAVLGIETTERTTMYVEWFGLYSQGLTDDFTIDVFNIGVDYYVTDDFVLDIRFGKGLSNDTDDFFSGIGGGYRF